MANTGRVFRVIAALLVAMASSAAGAATGGYYEDDPAGLIAAHSALTTNSVGTHDWQVWVCNVPGGSVPVTPVGSAQVLTSQIGPYLRWLSEGNYSPTFTPAGTVSSTENQCISEVVRRAEDTGATGAIIITDEDRNGGLTHPGVWCPTQPCAGLSDTYPGNNRTVLLEGQALYGSNPKLMTAAHEIGHSFHLGHSFTGLTSGTWAEYDNAIDILSGGTGERTELIGTPAINRYAAGWLDASKVASLGVGDELTLGPIGSDQIQLAALSTPNRPGVAVVIDVRVRTEYDADLAISGEGVTVHALDESSEGCSVTYCFGINRRVRPFVGGPKSFSHVLSLGESMELSPGVVLEVASRNGDNFTIRLSDSAPPEWGDEAQITSERELDGLRVSWPEVSDNSVNPTYEVVWPNGTHTTPALSTVVPDLSDDSLAIIEVTPIDSGGNRGRTLSISVRSIASSIGVVAHDPITGKWAIRSMSGTYEEIYFGVPGDLPLVCDWDGDGIQTVGLYRPNNGFVYVRNENSTGVADRSFFYGIANDVPLCGDWNGDGTDTVGIYRPAEQRFYLRNSNTQGVADSITLFGIPGDRALTGDWNGDGIDEIAVHRADGTLHRQGDNFELGATNRRWVVADWYGDGSETVLDFGKALDPYEVGVDSDVIGMARSTILAGSF